jgi:hypothetical protein
MNSPAPARPFIPRYRNEQGRHGTALCDRANAANYALSAPAATTTAAITAAAVTSTVAVANKS